MLIVKTLHQESKFTAFRQQDRKDLGSDIQSVRNLALVHICRCGRTFDVNIHKWGIYLTPVAPLCCGIECGRLSQNPDRIGGQIQERTGVSGLFVEAALAGGIRLSTVRHAVGLDDQPEPAGVCGMPVPGVINGRHDLSGYAKTADAVVPGDLVGDHAEEWRQCAGPATDPGVGQLRDCVDLAAQVAPGDGTTGPRSAQRPSGSGRDLRGWPGGGGSRSADGDQGFGCHSLRAGWEGVSVASGYATSKMPRLPACTVLCKRRLIPAVWSTPMAGKDMRGWKRKDTSTRSQFCSGAAGSHPSSCRGCTWSPRS